MNIHKKDNFLILVPKKTRTQKWEINDNGLVEIIVSRDRLIERFARKFIHIPTTTRIQLDPHGSFVWNLIDGKKNIWEIGYILEEKFGESIKPVYERLAVFITILRNNQFIILQKNH